MENNQNQQNTIYNKCGLANIGNTCYMNSVLQILVHNKQLRQYFVDKLFKQTLSNNISRSLANEPRDNEYENKVIFVSTHTLTIQFYRLLNEMMNCSHIAPITFKQILESKNDTFLGHSQNDSHELISYLLDTLHEETKCEINISIDGLPKSYHFINTELEKFNQRLSDIKNDNDKNTLMKEYQIFVNSNQIEMIEHAGITHWANHIKKNFSIVSKHFTGLKHSLIHCQECSMQSHSFEIFLTMPLEIPLDKEKITIFDCLDLFTRNEVMDGENKYACPSCNKNSVAKKKICLWNMPDVVIIQFNRFHYDHVKQRIDKLNQLITYDLEMDFGKYMYSNRKSRIYELTGVIHHYGVFGGGHYVSFNKVGNEWFQFNDSHISQVEDINKQIITESSYVLVYSAK